MIFIKRSKPSNFAFLSLVSNQVKIRACEGRMIYMFHLFFFKMKIKMWIYRVRRRKLALQISQKHQDGQITCFRIKLQDAGLFQVDDFSGYNYNLHMMTWFKLQNDGFFVLCLNTYIKRSKIHTCILFSHM